MRNHCRAMQPYRLRRSPRAIAAEVSATAAAVVLAAIPDLAAQEGVFYKELQVLAGYSHGDQWIGESAGQSTSAGFEDYRRFSSAEGDFLTTDIQARLAFYASRSRDVWGIEIHNAYAAYKIAYGHRVRLGHFDVPFGLEPVTDTHGTLLQTLAMTSVGFKQGWGAALEGTLGALDYEVAAQIGSGAGLRMQDESYLAASRLGSPGNDNITYGASVLYGSVIESMGMRIFPSDHLMGEEAVPKRLVGLDGHYLYGPVLLKGEAIYGESADSPVLGFLAQADCTVPQNQAWHIELQFRSWTGDLARDGATSSSGTVGASYRLSEASTLRVALTHDFEVFASDEDTRGVLQFYYYGD